MSEGMTSGGCAGPRRCLLTAVVSIWVLLPGTRVTATGDTPQDVTVREERGIYTVAARFEVPQPAAVARAVLTDYEQIPRFMHEVRTSHVLERAEGRAVVEQEAVARVLMFSKRVHLVLEVHEETAAIRFRDRCGKSFTHYEGAWRITEQGGRAAIAYELKAQPSFDVPEFLLKRLLKRDATQMIERLQAEIATRSQVRASTEMTSFIGPP